MNDPRSAAACGADQVVSVCVCTYRRTEMLATLLRELRGQSTDGFTFSVVVVDNDAAGSARQTVEEAAQGLSVPVTYRIEPSKNIARARNRAVFEAQGDLIAFIDDDEYPSRTWLLELVNTMRRTGASAVLGPVVPRFPTDPPAWVSRSRLCERERFPTGTLLTWKQTRTGNVLFERSLLGSFDSPFDPDFGVLGGEDVTFFRKALSGGRVAVWCDEAVVHEWVPEERTRPGALLRRAYLQGHISYHYHRAEMTRLRRCLILTKAAIGVLTYAGLLPLLVPFGLHRVMRYLVKLTHHLARLLTAIGWSHIKRRTI